MPGHEVYVQGISDCHYDVKSVLLVRHHCSDDFPYRMGFDVLAVPTEGAQDAEGRPAEPRMVFADTGLFHPAHRARHRARPESRRDRHPQH